MIINLNDRFRDKFKDLSVTENYIVFKADDVNNQYLLRCVQTDKVIVRSKEELQYYFIKEN